DGGLAERGGELRWSAHGLHPLAEWALRQTRYSSGCRPRKRSPVSSDLLLSLAALSILLRPLGLTDHLAPNDAVVGGPGFKLEKDAATGPTMKQKVRHILRKRGIGKTAMQSPEAATQAVDEIGECTHAGRWCPPTHTVCPWPAV